MCVPAWMCACKDVCLHVCIRTCMHMHTNTYRVFTPLTSPRKREGETISLLQPVRALERLHTHTRTHARRMHTACATAGMNQTSQGHGSHFMRISACTPVAMHACMNSFEVIEYVRLLVCEHACRDQTLLLPPQRITCGTCSFVVCIHACVCALMHACVHFGG